MRNRTCRTTSRRDQIRHVRDQCLKERRPQFECHPAKSVNPFRLRLQTKQVCERRNSDANPDTTIPEWLVQNAPDMPRDCQTFARAVCTCPVEVLTLDFWKNTSTANY